MMNRSEETIVHIVLCLYVLFSIFKPREYPSATFSCIEANQISFELVSTNYQDEHENSTKFRKKCSLTPLKSNIGWDEIANFSSIAEDVDLNKHDSIISNVQLGGSWEPECFSIHSIAIIVPYRNRPEQLQKFLLYMHTFLQLQDVRYRVFIVEQINPKSFNRGRLLNIGFVEASKYGKFPCFIFHDVDLLPENLQNIYACTKLPRHMSAVVDNLRYTLQYDSLFGGAISILSDQFQLTNGFSNNYFGWGGEDDDFRQRLKFQNIDTIRFEADISSYRMLPHKKALPSESRFEKLESAEKRFHLDGLNSLQYSVLHYKMLPLCTLIQVKFDQN